MIIDTSPLRKGNHPAGLNYGDAFAYALAKATGQPLLFKGDDFPKPTSKLCPDTRAG